MVLLLISLFDAYKLFYNYIICPLCRVHGNQIHRRDPNPKASLANYG